jgi:hypothetical protein
MPAGRLNQWVAWDKVEPMGEAWLQTATLTQAAHLDLFVRAGKECPEVEDFMPARYARKKVTLKSILMDGVGTAKEMAGQVKAMFGFGGK